MKLIILILLFLSCIICSMNLRKHKKKYHQTPEKRYSYGWKAFVHGPYWLSDDPNFSQTDYDSKPGWGPTSTTPNFAKHIPPRVPNIWMPNNWIKE